MRLSWPNVPTMLVCLTTLTLGACAQRGRPELATNIPDACEKLAKRVSHPSFKVNDDARIVLAKYAAQGGALDRANARLDAVRECSTEYRSARRRFSLKGNRRVWAFQHYSLRGILFLCLDARFFELER
jgi:hypothetical protein